MSAPPDPARFADPQQVAQYREGVLRQVPGVEALHEMTRLLLAEQVPAAGGQVLVLGAGGGMELAHFAARQPGWSLVGVDPSGAMLALARQTLGADAPRVTLVEGLIDSAPAGPFDGAVCLLTLHFLPPPGRLATLQSLYRRLRPGAVLVVAHHSVPGQDGAGRAGWLQRYAAFAAARGVPAERAAAAGRHLGDALPILTPAADEALLASAGFVDISLFYAAFTFRGWVARVPGVD